MTQAERIIGKFKEVIPLWKALEHKYPTTVQGWQERGFIPSRQHQPIIEAGQKFGVSVGPEDFFTSTDQAT